MIEKSITIVTVTAAITQNKNILVQVQVLAGLVYNCLHFWAPDLNAKLAFHASSFSFHTSPVDEPPATALLLFIGSSQHHVLLI